MPIAEDRLEQLQVLKLLQSVRNEDVEQIEKLTTHGVPYLINYSEPENGETGLHLAACKNNEKMISFLLDLGASPNMVDLKGCSPAMRAAEFGHTQALTLLAEADTDLSLRDNEGKGILFYCIQPTKRHLECLQIALKHGAGVNYVSKDGQPLLLVAAEAGLDNIVAALLIAGADPNGVHANTGQTALHAASAAGSVACVREILEAGADCDALDSENYHSAHRAAFSGHFDVIRVLAAYGADLGKVALDGNTPLHYAAQQGFGPICKFLSQRGCPSMLKNKEGKTPRLLAKDNEHKDALKECRKAEKQSAKLAKGASRTGEPYAIRLYDWIQEHEEKVLNICHQFDPEEEDGRRKGKITKDNFVMCLQTINCPLEVEDLNKLAQMHDPSKEDAVDYSLFITCKKFISKQFMVVLGKKKKKKGGKKGKKKKGKTKIPIPICTAPDGPRTRHGGPPADFVERYVHFTDNTRFDRDHPPSHPIQDDSSWYLNFPDITYVNISDAAKVGDLETLRSSFARGISPDQRDKYYKTPLMSACAHGNIDVAIYLLQIGADINARDNFKWTPLHHACHSGQEDLVQLLLENGAEMDAQTINGGTPLMRAIESSREAVVELLISKGAKVQLENKKGHTALDVAKAYADPRVVAIVQKRWDEIPPPVDKKKRGGSPRKKGPKSAAPSKTHMPSVKTAQQDEPPSSAPLPGVAVVRKSSVLRAASALGIINEKPQPIMYTPRRAWISQPTTEDLLRGREIRRMRYGTDIDFADYKPSFQKHITVKAEAMEAEDN
ncbi:ankyrin repeat and EF-hand domain-containing protein 1-like isoform X1 [Orbicella faveolata]|uniref:ankyrin repeat and EF-hand domain-containing protein 1-like isoform X1 n=1 Tax=Orbicella faveolata TaxID=48498 RepID=UPI0009E4440E|nr:ankyrin repeat and EF-hand domain-containing protein 1-like isoform X1 [Orbicella faveolata]